MPNLLSLHATRCCRLLSVALASCPAMRFLLCAQPWTLFTTGVYNPRCCSMLTPFTLFVQSTQAGSADLKVHLHAEAQQRSSMEKQLQEVPAELIGQTERAVSARDEAESLRAELNETKVIVVRDLEVGIHSPVLSLERYGPGHTACHLPAC